MWPNSRTRERARQQQPVGHKQVLGEFFMTSSAHFFLWPWRQRNHKAAEWPPGLRVQFRVWVRVGVRVRVRVKYAERPSGEELPSSSPTAVRGAAAVGTCSHFSRAFLNVYPFDPAIPQPANPAATHQRPRAKCHWHFNVLMKMRAKRKARAAENEQNMLKILWNCYKNSRDAVAIVDTVMVLVIVVFAFDSSHELIMLECGF